MCEGTYRAISKRTRVVSELFSTVRLVRSSMAFLNYSKLMFRKDLKSKFVSLFYQTLYPPIKTYNLKTVLI
jgi:hypothetical protein